MILTFEEERAYRIGLYYLHMAIYGYIPAQEGYWTVSENDGQWKENLISQVNWLENLINGYKNMRKYNDK